ncbi:MAG: Uma2 family endonuclease [Hyphomicrobiaceae bacterium]|nr:Uma2 family endonuclease [Hyphomicrobiaceae bacterium]
MADDFRKVPRWTLSDLLAFYEGRPRPETWELVDGVPFMMNLPLIKHQVIADTLTMRLDEVLTAVQPAWRAARQIGVRVPDDEPFCAEPDVAFIDLDFEDDEVFAERFYCVAEVLSGSDRPESRDGADKPIVLAAKLDFYKGHAPCRAVLVVRQDIIAADLHTREGADWRQAASTRPEERIAIPDVGDIGPLAHLYRHTPLWQSQFAAL